MKTLLILCLLSAPLLASDNCYVLELGSDSWLACKEQAGDMQKLQDQNREDLKQIQADSAAAAIADTQTEEMNQALRTLLIQRAIEQAQQNGGN